MEDMASLLVVAVQINLMERNKINFSVIKRLCNWRHGLLAMMIIFEVHMCFIVLKVNDEYLQCFWLLFFNP